LYRNFAETLLIHKEMKKLSLLLVLATGLFITNYSVAQTATTTTTSETKVQAPNPNAPVAKFDQLMIDMGTIEQNVPKTAEFKVTNDGKEPLLVTTAKASCGCTNLKYSSEPILPGKSANISATYNAAAMGVFQKTITVTTNADTRPVVLSFKGTVIAKTEPVKQ
jgi:hypothetical protein